jgi:hypothetical protein
MRVCMGVIMTVYHASKLPFPVQTTDTVLNYDNMYVCMRVCMCVIMTVYYASKLPSPVQTIDIVLNYGKYTL